ncbi:MAG: Fic family protein [Desulfobacterales bacterium]|jgi:Fic family protein|nr:Fic family protein [Desulfobacterales bacterium]
MNKYSHIQFRKHWQIDNSCAYLLGECSALVQAISNIPLKPEYRKKLLQVSLIKGAQATTAIEGNTLTEEEIKKIQEGWKVPVSREYQEIEVKNVIDALNTLLEEIIIHTKTRIIAIETIKDFHRMIGKNLGKHLDAIPGQFRTDNRYVGPYRAPDYSHVSELMGNLCEWLKKEFHFEQGQDFSTAVIQAIITHVYLEWIHPFGDGNGRTGRLLEFYILLRAGLPNIVSHVLSNFYNNTRMEYYRQLKQAKEKNNLTFFIEYAVQGFRDGLKENLNIIQESQFSIFWQHNIYETFADLKYTKKGAFKRKRALMLQMPLNKEFTVDEILELSPDVAKKYARYGRATVLRDLKELQELNLLRKVGRNYMANTKILKAMMSVKKS